MNWTICVLNLANKSIIVKLVPTPISESGMALSEAMNFLRNVANKAVTVSVKSQLVGISGKLLNSMYNIILSHPQLKPAMFAYETIFFHSYKCQIINLHTYKLYA